MTTRITSAEYESAGTIRCAHCWDNLAMFVEVSHTHDHAPNEHIVVCAECARLAGLMTCKSCAEEKLSIRAGKAFCDMARLYAPTELIGGRCAKHVVLRLQRTLTDTVSSHQSRAG